MDISREQMGARLTTDRGPDRDLTLFYAPFPLWTLTETKCTNFAKMQPRIAAAEENCRDLRSWCRLCTLCRDPVPFSGLSTCIRCILVHQGIPRSVKLSKNQLFINKSFLIMHLIGCAFNMPEINTTINGIFHHFIYLDSLWINQKKISVGRDVSPMIQTPSLIFTQPRGLDSAGERLIVVSAV